MSPDIDTVLEFFQRIGHPVALVGLKPTDPQASKTQVIWPAEQDDPADQACWLSRRFGSVYANLNPLADYMLCCVPPDGRSVSDPMIARRSRLLIDIDAHEGDIEAARVQKDAIKERHGPPLIESFSGRGFGLIYPIAFPNDEDAKQRVRLFIERLRAEFPAVDDSVYSAGRLTRVIGTLNRSIPSRLLN